MNCIRVLMQYIAAAFLYQSKCITHNLAERGSRIALFLLYRTKRTKQFSMLSLELHYQIFHKRFLFHSMDNDE